MDHPIRISPRGQIQTVYTDRLPLARLGQLNIARASHVNFNPDTQEWEVAWISAPGIVVFSHRSREECLQWEVAELHHRLRQD